MSGFSVGDRVVCSSHGVGKVIDIKVDRIADRDVKMYVIAVDDDNSKEGVIVSIPVASRDNGGLRSLVSESDIQNVVKVLREPSRRDCKVTWNKRLNDYNIKKGAGDPIGMAEVVRDLHKFAKESVNISNSEKDVYAECLKKLVNELSMVLKKDKEVIMLEITNILDGLQDNIRLKTSELVEEE